MDKKQIKADNIINTMEMHTGGEPLRIVQSGYPVIQGKTIFEKMNYAKSSLDNFRKMLMSEPRGHLDMCGAIPVEPDIEEADVAYLFMHNEGYSTMCGHAVIALGRYCIDQNMVKYREPETQVNIQCPSGLVRAYVQCENGQTGAVRFHSMPSFTLHLDFNVSTLRFGRLKVDVSYGGAFYGLVPLSSIGLNPKSSIDEITNAAAEIRQCLIKQIDFIHPYSHGEDLSFLDAIIFTEDADHASANSKRFNITVFSNSQIDRSPCGSGTTARVAALYAKKKIALNQMVSFENPLTQSTFTAQVVDTSELSTHEAVVVEVSGNAYYTGASTFYQEKEDNLKDGFLLS